MARRASNNRPREVDNRREKNAREQPLSRPAKPPAGNPATVAAVCGLLVLAVALVFAQSASHGFVNFDDAEYVAENPTVARGVTAEGFVWSFTHFRNGNWHPLTWL